MSYIQRAVYVNCLVLVLVSISNISIGQDWPGVDYSYARAYNYNLRNKLNTYHEPVKNGVLDTTMVYFGPKLTKKDIEDVKIIANRKWQALYAGLSGCYIPHHAIVFYNERHEIVAWMSVCFGCEAIRVFPRVDHINHVAKEAIIKAEKDLSVLAGIFDKSGLVMFNNMSVYPVHYDSLKKQEKINSNGFDISLQFSDSLLPFYNYEEIKENNTDLKFDIAKKYTAGGEKYYFLNTIDSLYEIYLMGYNDTADAMLTKFILADSTINLGFRNLIGQPYEKFELFLKKNDKSDAQVKNILSSKLNNIFSLGLFKIDEQDLIYFPVKMNFHFKNDVLVKIEKLE